MARRQLNVLQGWSSCTRCRRATNRFGVYAPRWSRTTRVVVMAEAAGTDVQAAQASSPLVEDLIRLIRARVGLDDDEVIGDVLVSCGVGPPGPDSIAACSTRFMEHDNAGARPELVVFVGRRVAALAARAGLLRNGAWDPCGASRPTPHVILDPASPAGGLKKITTAMGTARLEPSLAELSPNILHVQARDLLDVLGKHEGHGIRERHSREWKRTRNGPLTEELVRNHLLGAHWVAPFATSGPWPYAVLDLDRHDALQALYFDEVLAEVMRQFPNSFMVKSSDSGGAHVYVRLPPDTRYYTAARLLRVFVTGVGLRWKTVSGHAGQKIVTEMVEVPNDPPRLPFGLGSSLFDENVDLVTALSSFIDFCRSSDFEDYENAERRAPSMLDFVPEGPASSLAHFRWFHSKELEAAGVGESPLEPSDPWSAILHFLEPPLRVVATSGIPSFGTRHRWTYDLVKWLADFVPRPEVERLIKTWLRDRTHVSRDINSDLSAVERQTSDIIEEHYRHLRGVPQRIWNEIERRVEDQHKQAMFLTRQRLPRRPRQPGDPAALRTDFLKVTAFFVTRKFFSEGSRTTTIHERDFTRFGMTKHAGDIEKILTSGSVPWLTMTRRHVEGVAARTFELAYDLWPAYPHDEFLFVPPLAVPARVR